MRARWLKKSNEYIQRTPLLSIIIKTIVTIISN